MFTFSKKDQKLLLLFSLFLLLNIIVYFATSLNLQNKINFAKYNHLNALKIHYESWVGNEAEFADTIFFETMHTPKVLSLLEQALETQDPQKLSSVRKELASILEKPYNFYREKGLLQYHFVFPNNVSFLRMHKLEKFGDDLSLIREDFEKVNKTDKIVRGFSEGRTAHALRNVYPIHSKNGKHLGAIEISFPSELIQRKLNDISNIHSHFLVSKTVFDAKAWTRNDRIATYHHSVENEKYFVTFSPEHQQDLALIKREEDRINHIRPTIEKNMNLGKMFSELSTLNGKIQFISFYPIRQNVTQQVVAWLVSYDDDLYIQTAIDDTLVTRLVSFGIILLLLFFLNRTITQHFALKHLVEAYDQNVIYSTTDLRGKITHVSQAFCKISGYDPEELLGKSHNIVRHPDMERKTFQDMWQHLKAGKRWTGEVKNLKKDGSHYWVDVEIQPDLDDDNKVIGYKAIRHDITDSKELEITQKEIIFTMGSIGEARSKETADHVKRVAQYTELLATLIGLEESEAQMLKMASPMHDIGKIAIPDAILQKPAKLTEDEWQVMQTHSQVGYDLLHRSNTPLLKTAAIIAHQHHEKYDGTGYPNALKGEEIHIYGRITAIVDVYDALGSDRVYKKAWAENEVLEYIKNESAKQFDPKLVELFLKNIEKFKKIKEKVENEKV